MSSTAQLDKVAIEAITRAVVEQLKLEGCSSCLLPDSEREVLKVLAEAWAGNENKHALAHNLTSMVEWWNKAVRMIGNLFLIVGLVGMVYLIGKFGLGAALTKVKP